MCSVGSVVWTLGSRIRMSRLKSQWWTVLWLTTNASLSKDFVYFILSPEISTQNLCWNYSRKNAKIWQIFVWNGFWKSETISNIVIDYAYFGKRKIALSHWNGLLKAQTWADAKLIKYLTSGSNIETNIEAVKCCFSA